MKTKLKTQKIFFCILGLFILSCRPLNDLVGTPAAPDADSALQPAESPTASVPPTVAPTATVWPPIFSYDALGDSRELDSYTLTRTSKETGAGAAEEHRETIGYIKEPFGGYIVREYYSGGQDIFGDQPHQDYFIEGRLYATTASEDWTIFLDGSPDDLDYFLNYDVDIREGYPKHNVEDPQFVGAEDFDGTPAYHFTFDQTNLAYTELPDQGYKIETAQGDLYLSQAGNYLLYFHITLTGTTVHDPSTGGYVPGVEEVTEELSSINQLTEIAVPAEYLEPERTLLDLGLPLPAATTLVAMLRFDGSAVYTYDYATTLSNDEFLEFYKNLAPTDGWTVSHIGQVTNHLVCWSRDCAIIRKGDAQVILYYYESVISADYDKEHKYSPQ